MSGGEQSIQSLKEDFHSIQKTVDIPKGNVVFRNGDEISDLIVVISGLFEATSQDGSTEIIKPGTSFGTLDFDQSFKTTKTIKSIENGSVRIISSDQFKELFQRNSVIRKNIFDYLSKIVGDREDTPLHITFFDSKSYLRESLERNFKKKNKKFRLTWVKEKLNSDTVSTAKSEVIGCFVNDILSKDVIFKLKEQGVELIVMCCAGYDNVDIDACKEVNMSITCVPSYSPNAIAEFTIALMLSSIRKIHISHQRVRNYNFSLSNLVGFDINNKTVGVIGTGNIGRIVVKVLSAFGCNVLCNDVVKNKELEAMDNVKYVEREVIYKECDIISLHVPLFPSTKYILNKDSFKLMKKGVVIVNTSRGGLINSEDLLEFILNGHIGSVALDVYENESEYFFENRSNESMRDSILSQLIGCHNVMITSHQAFLTNEAMDGIAESVSASIEEYLSGKSGKNLTNSLYR